MNRTLQPALAILILCGSCNIVAEVVPYIAYRSQGFNAARELVGWQTQINKSCMDSVYGSFSVTPEYTRSFHAHSIAECLFSDVLTTNNSTANGNCKNTCNQSLIKIQGTKVSDRDPKALMAENFYLPTDFNSEVRFAPHIENFLVDLNLYVGLDNFIEGLYCRIHSPICYTRWNLNFCENIISQGTNNYDVGYFDDHFTPTNIEDPQVHGLERNFLLNSFEEYVCAREHIKNVPTITYQGLERARMSSKALTKTRLAEITAAIGWNFWTGDGYHVGLNIRGAAPSGNRPKGTYLFEPIVGNGHHWELGAGLTAHWRWWSNEEQDREFATYVDANITTLFSSRQERTFDLCGKPLSRYMLALKYTKDVKNLLAVDGAVNLPPSAQFANEFVPVANVTTIPVDVSVPLHIDAVLKCTYIHCNWQFDLGYNFWYRACENICHRFDCCSHNNFNENTYALKGDAFVYGFAGVNQGGALTAYQPGIPLSASEHKATIFSGTNNYPANTETWSANNGIDLPHLAWSNNFPTAHDYQLYTHTIGAFADPAHTIALATPVNTSYIQPLYITECDLNTDGAKNQGLSNKLFAHVSYLWQDCRRLTPYIGVGGEVEFGLGDKACACSSCAPNNVQNNVSQSDACHSKDDSCCKTCSLSQWGFWIKGGVSFN